MEIKSFNTHLNYNHHKPSISVILESEFTKEIRILLKKGQVMKEHQTVYPIIVHVIEGEISFGVNGQILNLNQGDIVSLSGNVPHDLKATLDSIVRLSLSIDKSPNQIHETLNQKP